MKAVRLAVSEAQQQSSAGGQQARSKRSLLFLTNERLELTKEQQGAEEPQQQGKGGKASKKEQPGKKERGSLSPTRTQSAAGRRVGKESETLRFSSTHTSAGGPARNDQGAEEEGRLGSTPSSLRGGGVSQASSTTPTPPFMSAVPMPSCWSPAQLPGRTPTRLMPEILQGLTKPLPPPNVGEVWAGGRGRRRPSQQRSFGSAGGLPLPSPTRRGRSSSPSSSFSPPGSNSPERFWGDWMEGSSAIRWPERALSVSPPPSAWAAKLLRPKSRG